VTFTVKLPCSTRILAILNWVPSSRVRSRSESISLAMRTVIIDYNGFTGVESHAGHRIKWDELEKLHIVSFDSCGSLDFQTFPAWIRQSQNRLLCSNKS